MSAPPPRGLEHRTVPLTTSGDGRTIVGVAVPYGQVTRIDDSAEGFFREQFAPGAFTRSIRERGSKVRLLVGHKHRDLPIGTASSLREDDQGLHAEFRVSDTSAGRDALTAVRDGLVSGLSVGFTVIRDTWQDDLRTVHEASLREVSLTEYPAYEGAVVHGVRHTPRSHHMTSSKPVAEMNIHEARAARDDAADRLAQHSDGADALAERHRAAQVRIDAIEDRCAEVERQYEVG